MKFAEKEPTFKLELTLQEAINLWHIARHAKDHELSGAEELVNSLHDFAANSNRYNDYLK